MRFCKLSAVLLMLSFALSSHAQQRDVALLAAACAACHGTNGHSVGGTPSIAALDESYFIRQMMQFRSGQRESTVMMQHAAGYTEEEIRLLAAYFAKQ